MTKEELLLENRYLYNLIKYLEIAIEFYASKYRQLDQQVHPEDYIVEVIL